MITPTRHDKESSRADYIALYTPKLLTVLREGYRLSHLRADAIAGLTVAIVALPLSMAIAIASGATPAQGLYTAIIGGFLVSLLGGSRFQIGGPAGAFIVLVSATVHVHGMQGLLLATMLSGAMLSLAGLLRFGSYIKFVPYPVTVGFTAGIAVIILASQLKDLFGLELHSSEPGPILQKMPVLWENLPSSDPVTIVLALCTIAMIAGLRWWRPNWPGLLIAVVAASSIAALFSLPVETIGIRFGGIPNTIPMPKLPDFSWQKISEVFPSALAFTLLGAIESLLSAVVADGMSGRRHRSNCELVAQGIANIASSLFGGICVTGTIARTVTNVRSRAHGPVSGMLHSAFLLLFILLAAPLASHIPLAALAGVLAIVAWNMVQKQAFAALFRASVGDAAVLMTTFLLTIFRDLTEAIVVGFALGALLFIHRMSVTTAIETHRPFVLDDEVDQDSFDIDKSYQKSKAVDPNIVIYRISGAFFFGVASAIGAVLDQINDSHQVLIIDFAAVPFLDSTGANTIETLSHKAAEREVRVILTGTSASVRHDLFVHGVRRPLVQFGGSVDSAIALAQTTLRKSS